jgi:hypothetical protein
VDANSLKRSQEFYLPIAKICSVRFEIVPIYYFQQKDASMGSSMSSPTSGFRKWSEAHDPKIAGARAVAGEPAVIPVPALDQAIMTPEEQPHRPWRVPGAGTL